ncbi:hypothetical protein D0T12_00445 [Actinomadura spongiicola]|uniref:Uncharacterized protein n=1 Tax=Actinomadura spongiicola TaxID=2303421 RepID=A0A372GNX2_9ACTN|nr:hypothetical protein [Actinomadura spongiicola]RFS86799.1 hypothetical protein D0T12_00445 [Actinomadura spongiicola]
MTAERVSVRVRDGRQIVTDTGHHYGGQVLTVPARLAREWQRYGWAEPVEPTAAAEDGDQAAAPGADAEPPDTGQAEGDPGDPGDQEGPSAPQGRANVRARIAEELAADPSRSDRVIAKTVGADHKTVGSVRRERLDADQPTDPGA